MGGLTGLQHIPVFQQLRLMKLPPLFNKPQGATRKLPGNLAGLDIDRDLVVTINGVEMSRRVLAWKDTDHNAKEARDFGHDLRCRAMARVGYPDRGDSYDMGSLRFIEGDFSNKAAEQKWRIS